MSYRGPGTGRDQGQGQGRGPGQGRGQHQGRGKGQNRKPVFFKSGSGTPEPSTQVTNAENVIQKGDISKTQDEEQMPRRPGYGDQGKTVKLWANYVELKMDPQTKLHRYDVAVASIEKEKPEEQSKEKSAENSTRNEHTGKKLARIIRLLLEQIGAYDDHGVVSNFSTILITRKEIQGGVFEIPYYDENESRPRENARKYRVTVQDTWGEARNLSDLFRYLQDPTQPFPDKEEYVEVLNIILNHYSKASMNHATIGARSFLLNQAATSLWPGLVAREGYYSSARLATLRILVNVNISFAVFYQDGELKDIMRDFFPRGIDRQAVSHLSRFLKGVRVEYSYLKDKAKKSIRRSKTIFDLASEKDGTISRDKKIENPPTVKNNGGPKDVTFCKDGKYVTVFEYFQRERGILLRHTDLPLINVGTRTNPTYIPPEMCRVLPAQRASVELNTRQREIMVRTCKTEPGVTAGNIASQGLETIGLSISNPKLRAFGFSADGLGLITVESRVLEAPEVRYALGKIQGRKVNWNLRGMTLVKNPQVKRYYCVDIQLASRPTGNLDLRDFQNLLESSSGLKIVRNPDQATKVIKHQYASSMEPLEKDLREFFNTVRNKVDFVLVALPGKDQLIYNCVKKLADKHYGITTVCVTKDRFTRMNAGVAGNIALKFNLKFRNNNQIVARPQEASNDSIHSILDLSQTMIVGIDVTHSPVDGRPSIAGMVASIDGNLGQWPAILRRQSGPRVEMVSCLREMLQTRLSLWKSRNGKYPRNVLVYRDGVSEGQYETVRKVELPRLQEACRAFYGEKNMPDITIVIVGKRHHTRFYPTKEADGDIKGNPKEGTVVDRGVTEALNWDFFLQPHFALQGVARPAHYFVVHDEIFRKRYPENAANKLETFTHQLCFMYGRSTCAVSICTPAYYADLVCDRARRYVDGEPISTTSHSPAATAGLVIHKNLEDTMFYI
ncbi:Piwi-domain-containing protein [Hypoxylon sp. NC1633]|nr:Piwi-domain-containing protein [Hypoxylon sp. NC1633]